MFLLRYHFRTYDTFDNKFGLERGFTKCLKLLCFPSKDFAVSNKKSSQYHSAKHLNTNNMNTVAASSTIVMHVHVWAGWNLYANSILALLAYLKDEQLCYK